MPPVPVYTSSPIAAKPSGVTPQTESGAEVTKNTAPATTTTSPLQTQTGYPQAQPGAVPSLPAPTGAAQARAAYIPATPTQGFGGRSDGPPPPAPGAVPQPTRTTHLPPPPKDGEKYTSPQAATVPYPQQMSIPAPTMAYPAQQTGTSSAASSSVTYGGQAGQSLEHPPGYHQNVNASELDRYQNSAMSRNNSEYQQQQQAEEEGVWNAAKKWAQATGEKLVAAETEVWNIINKG